MQYMPEETTALLTRLCGGHYTPKGSPLVTSDRQLDGETSTVYYEYYMSIDHRTT